MNRLLCYLRHARLFATQAFDGGIAYALGNYALKFIRMAVLMLVWRALLSGGADTGGMTLAQVLTYTLLASVFSEQLDIVTPATTSFWEGSISGRFLRPMPVTAQLIAETAGRWLPSLMLYSLPLLLAAPLIGVNVLPASAGHGLAFAASMGMAVSLGFALDFMFASLSVRLKNASYMAYTIRGAIMNLFSGVLIPFSLLPWGIGDALSLLPFGSLAAAPLMIFVGDGGIWQPLLLQLFWNAALWPLALAAFHKSRERMVSYGG